MIGDNTVEIEIDSTVRMMKIGDKKTISVIPKGKTLSSDTVTVVVEIITIERTGVSNQLADFVVTGPKKVSLNTPFDITITAVDKDGKTLVNYTGKFSMTSPANISYPVADEYGIDYIFKSTDK